ncbi:MAG: cupin domain-containing protein [Vulcanimicrobiaceae bacterium]
MSVETPNAKNHAGLGALRSRLVQVADLPWEPTQFPGIRSKMLVIDRDSGMHTALLKLEPGATLSDHEHVGVEQTYVLEGRLVDKEGPDAGLECTAGDFIWRPPGSRHIAWAPDGALLLAIFQVPNRFY